MSSSEEPLHLLQSLLMCPTSVKQDIHIACLYILLNYSDDDPHGFTEVAHDILVITGPIDTLALLGLKPLWCFFVCHLPTQLQFVFLFTSVLQFVMLV